MTSSFLASVQDDIDSLQEYLSQEEIAAILDPAIMMIMQAMRVLKGSFIARKTYQEAPDAVFELIVSKCSDVDEDGRGRGGLNSMRLANKRLKQVVESCKNMLTNHQDGDDHQDGDSFPIPIIQRCGRIEEIRCSSRNLRSLEGCPVGLKRLYTYSNHVSDLSPLASCSMMERLEICFSSITDISVVSSMPLLERFVCSKIQGKPSTKDLSSLSSCPMLKRLNLYGNRELKDLSPLSSCSVLETLDISFCPLITSLAPLSACSALEFLDIRYCPLITSLAALSSLLNLKVLFCHGIHPQTSLLPLTSCVGFKVLFCYANAVDLNELRKRRPELELKTYGV